MYNGGMNSLTVVHTLLLFVHLVGAGFTGVVLVQSIMAVLRNCADTYRPLAQQIALMLVLQIVSGCLLVIESHQSLSALEFCSKFSLYFIPIIGIEGLLFVKMGQGMIEKFPMVFVTRAFSLSLFIALGAMFLPTVG